MCRYEQTLRQAGLRDNDTAEQSQERFQRQKNYQASQRAAESPRETENRRLVTAENIAPPTNI